MTDPIKSAAAILWDEVMSIPWELATDEQRVEAEYSASRVVTAFFKAIPEASNADQ